MQDRPVCCDENNEPSLQWKIRRFATMAVKENDGRLHNRWWEHNRYMAYHFNRLTRNNLYHKARAFCSSQGLEGDTSNFLNKIHENPSKFRQGIKTQLNKQAGSAQYFYKQRKKLESILEQLGLPTVFLTLSCADMQDPMMHQFMHSAKGLLHKLADNPHISCEVFIRKLKDLFKYYLDDSLGILWKWLRYEFQNRYAIHAHALLKLMNEPRLEVEVRGKTRVCNGLAELGGLCIEGFEAERKMKKLSATPKSRKENAEEIKDLKTVSSFF